MGDREKLRDILEESIKAILDNQKTKQVFEVLYEKYKGYTYKCLKVYNLEKALGKNVPFIAFLPIYNSEIKPWEGIYPVLLFYPNLPIQKGKYPLVVAYGVNEDENKDENAQISWPKGMKKRTVEDCLSKLLGPNRFHKFKKEDKKVDKRSDKKIRYTNSYCKNVFLFGMDNSGNLIIEDTNGNKVSLDSVVNALDEVINDYLDILNYQLIRLPLYISPNLFKTFYHALKTKPFVILSGLSGTGKTKLFENFTNLFLNSKRLFLPVRPDFRDSKSLLGFYNPIQQKYQKTKLLDFILSAAKDYLLNGKDAVPYFILFDEMNLARVEYYFADFLSLLESKRFSSVEEALGDNEFKEFLEALGFEPSNLEEDRCAFTSASIPLHSEDGLREPPKNLFLPPNLYFIGTVNVDETTHVFSPKVLDRAFTIEFDVGSFKDYVEEFLEGRGGNVFCLPPKGKFQEEKLREDFIRKDAKTTIAKFTIYEPNDFKDIATKIKFKKKFQSNQSKELYKFLDELNGILKRYGFPFGYRVFNEILIFIKNATEGLKGLRLSYNEALDRVLLMKVLPKLYGTRKKLAPLIEELLKEIFAVKGVDVNRVETLPTIEGGKVKVRVGGEEKEVESPYPLTVKKLLEMAYKLSTDGYASYM